MPRYHRFILDEGFRALAVELPLEHYGADPHAVKVKEHLVVIRKRERFTDAVSFTYVGEVNRDE